MKTLISFFAAIRFLTILPIPWFSDKDGDHTVSCLKFFIFIGGFIGLFAFLLTKLLTSFVPTPVTICIIILFLASISGFLHLDGLADTIDGFFSSRPTPQKLEIMKDSRIGPMGVIALIMIFLFKFSALTTLTAETLALVVFFMPLSGRCTLILQMAFLPYARKEGGLGGLYYLEKGWLTPITTIAFFLIMGFLIDIHLTLFSLGTILAINILFGLWCKNAIGGATGDTLGASCELTEGSVALVLSIVIANI